MGVPITSWNFTGADWENPDPRDSRYFYCLAEAFKEKVAYCNLKASTSYDTTFLDAMPYENANLYAGFDLDAFDVILRPMVTKFMDSEVTLFQQLKKVLSILYDGETHGVPFNPESDLIARSRDTQYLSTEYYYPEFIIDNDKVWAVDIRTTLLSTFYDALENSLSYWTWESLCIDTLGMAGNQLATPSISKTYFTSPDSVLSKWISTRRLILDRLVTIGWTREEVSGSIIAATIPGTSAVGHYHYECESWVTYNNDPTKSCGDCGGVSGGDPPDCIFLYEGSETYYEPSIDFISGGSWPSGLVPGINVWKNDQTSQYYNCPHPPGGLSWTSHSFQFYHGYFWWSEYQGGFYAYNYGNSRAKFWQKDIVNSVESLSLIIEIEAPYSKNPTRLTTGELQNTFEIDDTIPTEECETTETTSDYDECEWMGYYEVRDVISGSLDKRTMKYSKAYGAAYPSEASKVESPITYCDLLNVLGAVTQLDGETFKFHA